MSQKRSLKKEVGAPVMREPVVVAVLSAMAVLGVGLTVALGVMLADPAPTDDVFVYPRKSGVTYSQLKSEETPRMHAYGVARDTPDTVYDVSRPPEHYDFAVFGSTLLGDSTSDTTTINGTLRVRRIEIIP